MNEAFASALVDLGKFLSTRNYHFITVTPLTHQRVLRNKGQAIANDLRDAFGWSMPFSNKLLPADLLNDLCVLGVASVVGDGMYKSAVRFSNLGPHLYAHSSFPTAREDAVFFGPDTYRFASLINSEVKERTSKTRTRILDMGCGSGVGGIVAAQFSGGNDKEIVLADGNPSALVFSKANVSLARVPDCKFIQTDLFSNIEGDFDFIVSNPPYLIDSERRTYRHGGGDYGEGLSQRIFDQSIKRLRPGGRLVLYTGSAIVQGTDPFSEWARLVAEAMGFTCIRKELDPDVFGEELDREDYSSVERIAAVGLVVERPKQ